MKFFGLIPLFFSLAAAVPITYTLEGTLNTLELNYSYLYSDYQAGDMISFSFVIDTDGNGMVNGEENSSCDYFRVTSAPQLFICDGTNPYFASSTDDFFIFSAGVRDIYADYQITNPDNSSDSYLYSFNSSDFPYLQLNDDVSGFMINPIVFEWGLATYDLRVTGIDPVSDVPEPGMLSCLFLGILCIAAVNRKTAQNVTKRFFSLKP